VTSFTPQIMIQNWFDSDPGIAEPNGFVRYDPATGEIMEVGQMPRTYILDHIDQDRPYIHAPTVPFDQHMDFMAGNYVDLATKQLRPKADFTATISGLTITGLPVPCKVFVSVPFAAGRNDWWTPQVYDWSDPDLELSFDTPDTYRVTIESVTHKTGQFKVTYAG